MLASKALENAIMFDDFEQNLKLLAGNNSFSAYSR
jgi:hypothetical protein